VATPQLGRLLAAALHLQVGRVKEHGCILNSFGMYSEADVLRDLVLVLSLYLCICRWVVASQTQLSNQAMGGGGGGASGGTPTLPCVTRFLELLLEARHLIRPAVLVGRERESGCSAIG
jgi:hypothetical protein